MFTAAEQMQRDFALKEALAPDWRKQHRWMQLINPELKQRWQFFSEADRVLLYWNFVQIDELVLLDTKWDYRTS